MNPYDLVIRGGTIVTADDQYEAEIGIRGGQIAAIGHDLPGRTLDATGRLVMPGGVDTHCHIEQLQEAGGADEESFATGTRAALAGGPRPSSRSPPNSAVAASCPPSANITAGQRLARGSTTRSTRSSPTRHPPS